MELPEDKGYAWVVAFGAWLSIFFTNGVVRIIGIIFINVSEIYQAPAALSALMIGIFQISGVLALIINLLITGKLSERIISMGCGLLLVVSMLAVVVSPNIYVFVVLFGITAGLGNQGLLINSMLMLGHYYKSKLSIVSGIVLTGSGVGKLVLSQLISYLLENYSVEGALVIFGGIILNTLIGAALFRPTSFYENTGNGSNKQAELSSLQQQGKKTKNIVFRQNILGRKINKIPDASFINDEFPKLTVLSVSKEFPSYDNQAYFDSSSTNWSPCSLSDSTNKYGYISDPTTVTAPSKCDANNKKIQIYVSKVQFNSEPPAGVVAKDASAIGIGKDVVKPSLCSSKSIPFFWAGRIVTILSYYMFVMFLPPYLTTSGLQLDGVALIISISGIADIPSRIVHGWIVSFERIDAALYTGVCTMIGAGIIGVCVILSLYPAFVSIGLTMGLLYSVNSALNNVLITECVGKRLYQKAYLLCHTPVSIAVAVLSVAYGYIYDITGSYFIQMMITVALGLLGGLLTIIESRIRQPLQ